MTLDLIPDIELTVSHYLREHPDVAALGARIVGQSPRDKAGAWVQIRQLDATNAPRSIVERLVSFMVQLDCYASAGGVDGSQRREVIRLARTVRAALLEMPGTHDDVFVSSTRIVGDLRAPDTDIDEPARDRVILTAVIHAHSLGGA